MYKLNLSQPLIIDIKQKPAPTKLVQWPFLELPIKEERKSDIFKKVRYVVGKTDIKFSLDDMWDLMLFFFSVQGLPLPHNYYTVQWRV